MQIVSSEEETIYMKCQILFPTRENKKKYFTMSAADLFLLSMLSVDNVEKQRLLLLALIRIPIIHYL